MFKTGVKLPGDQSEVRIGACGQEVLNLGDNTSGLCSYPVSVPLVETEVDPLFAWGCVQRVMSNMQNKELELKLDLAESDLERLEHTARLKDLASGPPRTRNLRSTYFDTKDHALRKAGMSLRIRRSKGALTQTLKCNTGVLGGISNPFEYECAVGSLRPQFDGDAKIQKMVARATHKHPLKPVFETRITRTTIPVQLNGTKAELCLDRGRVESRNKRQKILEAELELISGDVDGFLNIAESLFAATRLTFSRLSKAERGYRLITGSNRPNIVPLRALKPTPDSQGSAARCLCFHLPVRLRTGFDQLAGGPPDRPSRCRPSIARWSAAAAHRDAGV